MKVGDTVSLTKPLKTFSGEILPIGSWGNVVALKLSLGLIVIKFRCFHQEIHVCEDALKLETPTEENEMIAEYAAQGGFEPDEHGLGVRSDSPNWPTSDTKNDPPDMINYPPHYQSDTGIECIDAIRAMLGKEGFIAFLRGTILAYQWRLGRKDDPAQELGKIGWYQNRLREALLDE